MAPKPGGSDSGCLDQNESFEGLTEAGGSISKLTYDTFGQTPEFFSTWAFQRAGWWWQLAFPQSVNDQRERRRDKKTNTNLDGNWNAFCFLILEVKTAIFGHTGHKHGAVWEMATEACGCQKVRWVRATWSLVTVLLLSFSIQWIKLVSLIVVAPLLHSKGRDFHGDFCFIFTTTCWALKRNAKN